MTSLDNVMTFWEWFDTTRGNMSVLEIEKRGGAPRGRISNVYRKKQPSAMVCETIAKGLGVKQSEVFRLAGLLPPIGGKVDDLTADEAELVKEYRGLSPMGRQYALRMLQGLKEAEDKEE